MKANIEKQWKTNRPSAASALKKIKLDKTTLKPEDDPVIIGFVKSQAWPSAVIKDAGPKGEGKETI